MTRQIVRAVVKAFVMTVRNAIRDAVWRRLAPPAISRLAAWFANLSEDQQVAILHAVVHQGDAGELRRNLAHAVTVFDDRLTPAARELLRRIDEFAAAHAPPAN